MYDGDRKSIVIGTRNESKNWPQNGRFRQNIWPRQWRRPVSVTSIFTQDVNKLSISTKDKASNEEDVING